ncbi:MAG: family HAD-type hydrolase [Devosia sp.]|uniref:TIGR01459 family HAD-type hydrolase n=1 Tax=Devosia sp. TaxID=1871048 RepID=UPI0026394FE1|nr:TIGR01459 family HAD-type hydrolase [Devosia sp.]MDB5538409.1 family HAD-type hydrolase [Devosia sp.]
MIALDGLGEIAPRYDAVLSDVWGVVHNGVAAHPTAVEALVNYRRQGGRVVLITNAPRPSTPIITMLDDLGVSREAYDSVVSSGDATRVILADYRGKTVHYVGPPDENDSLFDGLDITVGPPEQARAVVVTDLDHDDDTPDMYNDRITLWLSRNLPLIAANPDRVVEHGDRLIYCGGALADLYEARGGMIVMVGKPYKPIYTEALRLADKAAGKSLDRSRILAIGDSVRTDAIGAAGAGLDLLFITGSIHAAELDAFGKPDPEAIRALVGPSGANVAGFMPRLAW